MAGVLAAIPVAVTFFILWYVDSKARSILRIEIPFLGIAIALGAIYLLGLFVTSVIGKFLIGVTDWILGHVPGLRDLYRAWKQVALTDTHDGGSGSSGAWCWCPTRPGAAWSSASPAATRGGRSGGLLRVHSGFAQPDQGAVALHPPEPLRPRRPAPQEAIKMIISGGNYVPRALGAATAGGPRI